MYFVEQYKRQFQMQLFSFQIPQGEGLSFGESLEGKGTQKPTEKPDAKKLAERAGKLSFGIDAKLQDADRRMTGISRVKPEELSMGKEIDPNAKPEKPEEFPVGKEVKISTEAGVKLDEKKYTELVSQSEGLKQIEGLTNPELTKALVEKYGSEKTESFTKMLEEMKARGEEIPTTIEGIEALIQKGIMQKEGIELKKEDPNAMLEGDILRNAAGEIMSNPSSGPQMNGYYESTGGGQNINFGPGEGTEGNQQLDAAIQSSTGQVKTFLESAKSMIGKNENNPEDRKILKSFLGCDPANTPWCKAFVNACAKQAGISLNSAGSLYSRAAVNDGQKVNIPQEKPIPGDLVIVAREGSAGGAPAGHIGICVGIDASGYPIIVGGNQGSGVVSVKSEKRPIISVNRVAEGGNGGGTNSEALTA